MNRNSAPNIEGEPSVTGGGLPSPEASGVALRASLAVLANSYPITVHDLDGKVVFANQQYHAAFGTIDGLVLEPTIRIRLALGQQWSGQLRHNGRLTNTTASMLPASNGTAERIMCVHHDITEQTSEREALQRSAERMQHILAMSTDLYWEQDEHRRFTLITGRPDWVSGKAQQWIGKVSTQIPEATLVDSGNDLAGHLNRIRDREPIRDVVLRVRDEGAPEGVRWLKIYGEPFFDAHGKFKGYRGIGTDISAQEHQRQDLLLHKGVDRLTGLRNKPQALAVLERMMKDSPDKALSLVMLDIDGFRNYEDAVGHKQSNAMLQRMATSLLGALSPGDFVARTGDHEFAIVRPTCAELQCLEGLLHGVKECLAELALDSGSGVPPCTLSIGVASCPADGAAAHDLMRNAELALLTTRQRGGNSTTVYDKRFRTNLMRQHRAVRGVSEALREGQLFMVYQPVVNPSTRDIIGAEALLRWRHPEMGDLSPGFFIEALNNKVLAGRVGQFVMNEVVRQAAQWRADGVKVGRVAFNVMEADFTAQGFAGRLEDSMKRWGALPEDICVEVTEGMFLGTESASIIKEIAALADMGVEVAFDDFGTGFASLAHLRLPTSRIKIDRSFVSNLTTNLVDREIVTAVVNMGRAIGKAVTAEGIETPAQRDALLAIGCDSHQGFLYSKGIEAHEIQGFVSRFESERV